MGVKFVYTIVLKGGMFQIVLEASMGSMYLSRSQNIVDQNFTTISKGKA